MRALILVAIVTCTTTSAYADEFSTMIGPVIGLRLGGSGGSGIGIEAGGGFGPQRVNLGFERRAGVGFSYVELDPWLVVGGSFGLGIDTDGEYHSVIGAWEGVPLLYPGVNELRLRGAPTDTYIDHDIFATLTVAVGYRYTGVHELYVTIKTGAVFCPCHPPG